MDIGFSYYFYCILSQCIELPLLIFHCLISNFDSLSASRDQDSAPTSVIKDNILVKNILYTCCNSIRPIFVLVN